MKTQRWLFAALILLCNVAILARFAKSAIDKADSYKADFRDSDSDFRKKTDEKTVELEVGKVATHARLNVEIRVPGGVMQFRLLDPAGKERLQDEVSAAKGSFDTREMLAMDGV